MPSNAKHPTKIFSVLSQISLHITSTWFVVAAAAAATFSFGLTLFLLVYTNTPQLSGVKEL